MKEKRARITTKGEILLAAIDSGLIPETEKGYSLDNFERFWKKAEKIKWDKTEHHRLKRILIIWRGIAIGFMLSNFIEMLFDLLPL